MFLRQWARKDLERGDLNALRELSKRWNDPSPARMQRLSKRGFLQKREGGELRVTVKGRAALLLRRR
jgi:hypothetical protein